MDDLGKVLAMLSWWSQSELKRLKGGSTLRLRLRFAWSWGGRLFGVFTNFCNFCNFFFKKINFFSKNTKNLKITALKGKSCWNSKGALHRGRWKDNRGWNSMVAVSRLPLMNSFMETALEDFVKVAYNYGEKIPTLRVAWITGCLYIWWVRYTSRMGVPPWPQLWPFF